MQSIPNSCLIQYEHFLPARSVHWALNTILALGYFAHLDSLSSVKILFMLMSQINSSVIQAILAPGGIFLLSQYHAL